MNASAGDVTGDSPQCKGPETGGRWLPCSACVRFQMQMLKTCARREVKGRKGHSIAWSGSNRSEFAFW